MVLGDEELSENTQLLEFEIERFEVRKRRTKADNQKRQSDIKNKKKESSRIEKKATERFGETRKRKEQDESDTGNKNKVEGVVQKWLVFFKKNLNKIVNFDQKVCKKKTMKDKLGKDSITGSLYKMQAQ